MASYDYHETIHQENDINNNIVNEGDANNGILYAIYLFLTSDEFTSNMFNPKYWMLMITDLGITIMTVVIYLLILFVIIMLMRAYFARKRTKEISEDTKKKLHGQ
jgi:uncharacterized membrane protein